ncbi:MAG: hypothetical protein MUF25_17340 [Pirellulaceae bacterium]|nr:hypothetical protein [Pirellulaceae bacterium]
MPSSVFPAPFREKMLKKHRPRAIQRLRRRRHLVFEPLEDRRVLASIAGQVVYDFDGDAILEEHEPGLPGWQIYADNNNNEQYDDGEPTALTDVNGEYELADLSVGFYTLRRVPQAGWQQTYPPGVGKHTVNIRNSTQEVLGVDSDFQRL